MLGIDTARAIRHSPLTDPSHARFPLPRSFALHLAPLYPIIPPRHFLPAHFETLATDEPLLLAAIVAVAARFAPLGPPGKHQAAHDACATWIRQAVVHLLDGLPKFRTVATVEALLVLSEWPLVPFQKARVGGEEGAGGDVVGGLVAPIEQYDGFAWSYVGQSSSFAWCVDRMCSGTLLTWRYLRFAGMAVRLAQELGLNETEQYTQHADGLTHTWMEERNLRTWLYAFNADRHIALRRGKLRSHFRCHRSSRHAFAQALMIAPPPLALTGRPAIIHQGKCSAPGRCRIDRTFDTYPCPADCLTSTWWETVSRLASLRSAEVRVAGEVWDDDIAQGLIAALMATIQVWAYTGCGKRRPT